MGPMLLAQISDLHIKPPGQLAYGKVDTAAFLRATVASLLQQDPKPDAVVATGDLVDGGQAEEYDGALKSAPARLRPRAIGENLAQFVVGIPRDASDVAVREVGFHPLKGGEALRILLDEYEVPEGRINGYRTTCRSLQTDALHDAWFWAKKPNRLAFDGAVTCPGECIDVPCFKRVGRRWARLKRPGVKVKVIGNGVEFDLGPAATKGMFSSFHIGHVGFVSVRPQRHR